MSRGSSLDTLSELAPRLAAGVLSAEALVRACLARIGGQDHDGASLGAILRLNPHALDEARRLDQARGRSGPRGPLHGAPLVVKDNIDVAGLPTTSGSRALARAMPRRDAEQIRRLKAAGAIVLAKTNLSEFSFEIRSRSSIGGDVLNPFNRAVTAGGSSGGTAAAIAAGFAVCGLGTDTGGSIRVPAAYNGLVGLRPTHGRLSLDGVAPLAPSTDTIGPIARSVADARALFSVMSGQPIDAVARPLNGARIGILRQAFGESAEIGAALETALEAMSRAGAVLVDPVTLPDDILPIGRPHVVDWEFGPAFDHYLKTHFAPGQAPASLAALQASGDYLADYGESLPARAAIASLDHPTYREILAYHRDLGAALDRLMSEHRLDALAYPTSAVIPDGLDNPKGGWAPELAACSGRPAITLPVGQAASGIPIGFELLGHRGGEAALLDLAEGIEQSGPGRPIPNLG